MDRLFRFTSSTARVNHGIITQLVGNGAYILFDTFAVTDRVTLPVRYSYVSFMSNPYVVSNTSKREVLPLTANVPWQDERVAKVAAIALGGNFEAWWQANGQEVAGKLYKAQYKKQQGTE